MYMFDFIIIIGIDGWRVTKRNDVLIFTIYQSIPRMDAAPLFFVVTSVKTVHALEDTGYVDILFTARHANGSVERSSGILGIELLDVLV